MWRRLRAGDFDWFSNDDSKKFGGTSLDWDNDGIDNPYDWTPTSVVVDGRNVVGVNLTLSLTGEFGTAGNPWPIYNVWQLQAIEGVSVSHTGAMRSPSDFEFFAFNSGVRFGAQYRLATNIDATPTKQWDGGAGFDPIGGTFSGFFDGGGYAVRGLFINRPVLDRVGLFRDISKSGELAVSNLGVEDADIRGRSAAGIISGQSAASFSKVWTTGEVVAVVNNVGGLVGLFLTDVTNPAPNTIMMSWSTANVRGNQWIGGLIGSKTGNRGGSFAGNWAAGDVRSDSVSGGLFGRVINATLDGNWSSGSVSGDGSNVGGFVGSASNADTDINFGYWNRDTSGRSTSGGGVAAVVQTLAAANFGGDDATLTWAFGDDADFPLLTVLSRPWQAVNLARSLTRVFGLGSAATTEATTGMIFTTNGVRLDTNGLAPDTGSGGTSTPTCSFESGVLRAQTNYNGVTVELSLLTDGSQNLVEIAPENTANCEIGFENADDEFAATLRVEISAPATAGFDARSLTTDYALRIAPDLSAILQEALDNFVAEIARGDFDWFSAGGIVAAVGGSPLDWDGDGINNPYDLTPTSVMIGGNMFEVNLTTGFTGEGGTADNPWPIYNVWQLQAIDGLSVSDVGATLGGLTLFGDDAATRLGAQYRLATNIDATRTKQWDGGAGFDPIGGVFRGFLDGGGYAVRDLFINRGGNQIGLFAQIQKNDGGLAVRNMGVEDADIRGAGEVGILAGSVTNASFSGVWTTGKVFGSSASGPSSGQVGGLIGHYESRSNDSAIGMSWSAADVASNANAVGGLIGFQQGSSGSFNIDDNWAAGDVRGGNFVGGFTGLPSAGDYARNWSSGAVSARSAFLGGFTGSLISGVSEYIYWNEDASGVSTPGSGEAAVVQTLAASNFGDGESSAWAGLDDNADFPLLTVHSRPWQAVNLARALTRVVGVGDGAATEAATGITFTTNGVRLDTNGLAPDTGSGGTSTPTCSFDDASGVLRAQTNYNGVTVELSFLNSGGSQALVSVATTNTHCEVGFTNAEDEFEATFRVEISAPATLTFDARSLTTDYALRIAPERSAAAREIFLAEIARGDFNWFSDTLTVGAGTPLDWDDDGIENPYDWTPTSVAIVDGGPLIEVNLTAHLTGAGGTAGNPWPIYNVWQLQAIDGVSVSEGGTQSAGLVFFGADASAALEAQYRLALDIDATPTKNGKTMSEPQSDSIPSAGTSPAVWTAAARRCAGFSSIGRARIMSGCLQRQAMPVSTNSL